MPWKEHRSVDLRREFVLAAKTPGANISQLCRDFGISRNNGYKRIRRHKEQGIPGLEDRSRRSHSVGGTSGETMLQLIELRRQYPKWGPKKLRQLLLCQSGHGAVPSVKTVTRILDRAGEPRVRRARRRLRLVFREHQKHGLDFAFNIVPLYEPGNPKGLNSYCFKPEDRVQSIENKRPSIRKACKNRTQHQANAYDTTAYLVHPVSMPFCAWQWFFSICKQEHGENDQHQKEQEGKRFVNMPDEECRF
jgi:hypothetical protein